MTITFEIDDALIPAIEQFLSTQVRVESDPVTQSQTLVRIHESPAAFLEDALHQVVDQTVRRFPPPHIREQMAAHQALNNKIKEMLRPRRVDSTGKA